MQSSLLCFDDSMVKFNGACKTRHGSSSCSCLNHLQQQRMSEPLSMSSPLTPLLSVLPSADCSAAPAAAACGIHAC
jgi:hypothetical protein